MSRSVSECPYCNSWYADDEDMYGVHECFLKKEHLMRTNPYDEIRKLQKEILELQAIIVSKNLG